MERQIGRILSIDYGSRRTGLAITDREQRIATRLSTIATEEVLSFLRGYAKEETILAFVIGDPRSLSGGESEATPYVNRFASKLTNTFPHIPIHWVDERFSSVEARRAIAISGLSKKKRSNKSTLDSISAVLILQTYLAKRL